jgi:peptidoglycan/LPS O-acetylase OafA/YrhL
MSRAPHGAAVPRVFGLDLLRALAIVLVMVAHSRPNALYGTRLGDYLDGLGPPGVEIFFALSGFLIGGILLRELAEPAGAGVRDIARFWKRRWFRTLPNYYLFLGVHVALALGRHDPSLTVAAIFPHLFFVQNLLSAPPAFFFGSWTLAIEEWSYLLLPPLLWVGRRLGLPGPRAALAGMAVLVAGSVLFRLASHAGHVWSLDVQKAVLRRLDALLFGVAAAWLARYRPAVWARLGFLAWPGAIGLAALAALGVQWGDFAAAPGWVRVLYPTGLGISCAALLPWASRMTAGDGPAARAVRFVSLVSYSLYLSHVPLRIVLYQVCFVRLHLPANWGGEAVFQIVCWTSYLAFAGAVYRWFEKPVMDLRD